ncbi:hypothetical protein [uncultured Robinsoniella sp.]|uniref:hypothetical protein n=1 Tax=uncultured Robinsoniella sp. TaxID=904190 RepID=UPI00374EB860
MKNNWKKIVRMAVWAMALVIGTGLWMNGCERKQEEIKKERIGVIARIMPGYEPGKDNLCEVPQTVLGILPDEDENEDDDMEGYQGEPALVRGMYLKLGKNAYYFADVKSNELFSVVTADENKIYGLDGKEITFEELKTGNIVDIYYTGGVMESYPIVCDRVVKMQVTEEGSEADAEANLERAKEFYCEPDPNEKPALQIQYVPLAGMEASSNISERAYQWTVTNEDGTRNVEKTDSQPVIQAENLEEIEISQDVEELKLVFSETPGEVVVKRWRIEERGPDQIKPGEAVLVTKKEDKMWMIPNGQSGYVYEVTGKWGEDYVMYGFVVKMR